MEQAVRALFREFLNCLLIVNELDQVVFNECYLTVTVLDYCLAIGLLPLLQELEYQIVFLTRMMPLSLVN